MVVLSLHHVLYEKENSRQWYHAKKLYLLSDPTDGAEFFSDISSGTDSARDAGNGRILMKIYERL